jgi:copper resistance protein C
MRLIYIVSILLLLLLGAVTAHAHALLDRASPLVGSTVRVASRVLSLWFTQSVEQASSAIEVRDARGARVEQGKAQVVCADRNLLRIETVVARNLRSSLARAVGRQARDRGQL